MCKLIINKQLETHTNESISQCQVVRLTNRPKKLLKKASLQEENFA